jgi:two-component system response regulator YcbB
MLELEDKSKKVNNQSRNNLKKIQVMFMEARQMVK